MQFSTVFTILAAAMTASAIPQSHRAVNLIARGDDGDSLECSSQSTAVCCNGIADCLINVAAKNCDNSAYCCDSSAVQGGVVNVNALNCVKLL